MHFAARNAESKGDRLARSYVARLALLRVMYENRIDVFVHPENTVPPPKIQGPLVGSNSLDGITPFFQIPRIVVPAGTTDVVYEPRYALSADKRTYISVLAPGTPKSTLAHPMPVALTFFSGQGEEPVLIKVGTAYESATHHRRPPPAFGPVSGKTRRNNWLRQNSGMDRAASIELVTRLFQSADRRDLAGVAACYDEHAVAVTPVLGEIHGRDAIAQTWRKLFEDYPDLRAEVSHVLGGREPRGRTQFHQGHRSPRLVRAGADRQSPRLWARAVVHDR